MLEQVTMNQEMKKDDDDDERSFEGRHSPGWKNQRRRGQYEY